MPAKKHAKSSDNGTNSNDPLIDRFEDQWESADELSGKAKILRRYVQYVKKRYGNLAAFSNRIEPKVAELETELCRTYDFCAGVIGDVRRTIKNSGRNYGSALRRKPTGAELAEVRTFKGPARVTSVENIAEIDPDSGDDDDLRAGITDNSQTELDETPGA
jgi:hypothetical protein